MSKKKSRPTPTEDILNMGRKMMLTAVFRNWLEDTGNLVYFYDEFTKLYDEERVKPDGMKVREVVVEILNRLHAVIGMPPIGIQIVQRAERIDSENAEKKIVTLRNGKAEVEPPPEEVLGKDRFQKLKEDNHREALFGALDKSTLDPKEITVYRSPAEKAFVDFCRNDKRGFMTLFAKHLVVSEQGDRGTRRDDGTDEIEALQRMLDARIAAFDECVTEPKPDPG